MLYTNVNKLALFGEIQKISYFQKRSKLSYRRFRETFLNQFQKRDDVSQVT